MTIDQLADNALASVRSWYKTGVKSNNKWRTQPDESRVLGEQARIRASGFLQRLGRTYEAANGPYAYGSDMASYYRAGNCWDLAIAAMHAVLSMDITVAVRVIAVPAPGDHAFLTIGGTAVEVLRPFADQATSDGNYCICDPWANIACRGNVYVQQFNTKMDKWAQDRKFICFQNRWCVPTDPAWIAGLMGRKEISREGLV